MDISLTPNNEKFINSQISAGLYKTINDAINDAISIAIKEMTPKQEKIKLLNLEIQKGLDDVKNNRYSDALEFLDELMSDDEI